jgi:class 3 adenylate cyclase
MQLYKTVIRTLHTSLMEIRYVPYCFNQTSAIVGKETLFHPMLLLWKAFYLGPFDGHDPAYDSTIKPIPFYLYKDEAIKQIPGHCQYTFNIYASSAFESRYLSDTPKITALAATSAFVLMGLFILAYDWFVRRQNQLVQSVATRSGAIATSLFPAAIRNRLIIELMDKNHDDMGIDVSPATHNSSKIISLSKPIADLFPSTTVLFADLAGFTAWSSTHPPEHVFMLLEAIYRTFDGMAQSLGVYKVETIGDCYVAVTGLPVPQPDHAVIMARFARDCIHEMQELLPLLSKLLGHETADLALRVGIHSGPVTAGVLRGDRARFQLFGETVRIASMLEHSGIPNRIQASQATADLLTMGGKGAWLSENSVIDGETTYWVAVKSLGEMVVFQKDSSSESGH